MGQRFNRQVGAAILALLVQTTVSWPARVLAETPADEPTRLTPAESADVVSMADQGSAKRLLRDLALAAIPERYNDEKRWGKQKRVWNGVHISLDGLRVKTKRKWRDVNHGTWERYQAWLIDPEEQFDLRIENIRPTEGGRIAFDIFIDAHLGLFARLSEWQVGVQLISLSTDAEAVVRMRMTCEASMSFDFEDFVPAVVIEPEITAADLTLVSFDLQRISNLHGPGVEQLGRKLHKVLQDEINDRRPKLVEKANRQIEKNRHKLRLSAKQLADDGWEKAQELLQQL